MCEYSVGQSISGNFDVKTDVPVDLKFIAFPDQRNVLNIATGRN